ncbi:MAG: phosphonate metabolism protein/1,5-bisphosphokinase (PRPP-forming) PhnN [Minwuia sp.]|uniref:phosphonate metabolism protein/1,5-bisphosphokinase (PRPP-forming) PhnN n=1 Tax=Minwuia sp. TaxID=2493630 RepID=UPI003A88D40B
MSETGGLVVIVGPSGSGKDTLIDRMRDVFDGDPGVQFVRRTVTRPVQPGTEDHDSLSERDFEAAEARGSFCVTWRANGLAYGWPAELKEQISDGAVAIANGSRQALPSIRAVFPKAKVVALTVNEDELRRRLHARGRETAEQIEARIQRSLDSRVRGPNVVTIDNSGAVGDAARELERLIRSV